MIVYSPLAQGVLTNKYAGGARPEGSRATGAFAHFLEAEKALTPENVAAAERLAAWCAGHGLEPAPVAIAWVLRHDVVASAIVGATSVGQFEQNLKALEVKLSASEWREVEAVVAGLSPRLPRRRRAGPAPGRRATASTRRR
jgi:L-glyceraldehyde 3-phosphate reductase